MVFPFKFKKKKPPQPIDEERMRVIIQEELSMRDAVSNAIGSKETRERLRKQKIMSLPKHTRLRLLRLMAQRKAEHEKR